MMDNKDIYSKVSTLLVTYFGKEIVASKKLLITYPNSILFKDQENERFLFGNFYKKEDDSIGLILNVSLTHNKFLNNIFLKAYETKTFKRVVALKKILDKYFSTENSILYFHCSIKDDRILDCFSISFSIDGSEYVIDFLNEYYQNKRTFDESFIDFVETAMGVLVDKPFRLRDIAHYGKNYQIMKY